MAVTKPYEFIGFGAMAGTKPYEIIRFGAMADKRTVRGPAQYPIQGCHVDIDLTEVQ